ncbi:hypothetical protein NL676_003727 [Syzygium grande]|nr:hypothetical protein NL676_003727 [Syzygium grande]
MHAAPLLFGEEGGQLLVLPQQVLIEQDSRAQLLVLPQPCRFCILFTSEIRFSISHPGRGGSLNRIRRRRVASGSDRPRSDRSPATDGRTQHSAGEIEDARERERGGVEEREEGEA